MLEPVSELSHLLLRFFFFRSNAFCLSALFLRFCLVSRMPALSSLTMSCTFCPRASVNVSVTLLRKPDPSALKIADSPLLGPSVTIFASFLGFLLKLGVQLAKVCFWEPGFNEGLGSLKKCWLVIFVYEIPKQE